jgi:chaperone required for assembly of F1-ATPase
MKRIWKTVAAQRAESGWHVLLDAKPIKKPGGAALHITQAALAEAIADEWRQAGLDGAEIKPDDLPITRLATTAIDRVPANRPELIGQLAAYGANDMLCYRSENPPSLASREAAAWDPWLAWAAQTHGVALNTGTGITPITQPPETTAIFEAVLSHFTNPDLAALGVAVPAMGSLILGLALAAGELTPETAFELSTLEETYQIERWGTDDLSESRRLAILTDLQLCKKFLELCR